MKRGWFLPIAVMMLCCIAACGSENMGNPGVEGGNASDAGKKDMQEIVEESNDSSDREPLKTFLFETPEDVEKLSDEDFLYIVTHAYKPSDFFEYDTEQKIDLFGIPLVEWEFEGMTLKEEINPGLS